MTREEVSQKVLTSPNKDFILELPTGFGKTKIALEKIKSWKAKKILIVVPKLVLIPNWESEIKKWKCEFTPTFTTYVSFPKIGGEWDVVVFDESHHITSRVENSLKAFKIHHTILLSATLKAAQRYHFKNIFKSECIKVRIEDAILNEVLPSPKIILVPLKLTDVKVTFPMKLLNFKTGKYFTKNMSAKEVYEHYCSLVEYYKSKNNDKNVLLFAVKRLKHLAELKTDVINNIVKSFRNKRLIVFTSSIAQSAAINCKPINSKDKKSLLNLQSFNSKKIKHVSAVQQLDEGINLESCQIGVFQMINTSNRINIQRIGRILRHKQPIIVLPYFENTKEEDTIKGLLADYSQSLIETMSL